ncbi:MAG: hypothetical protein KatS3mg114_0760 [Planctomycetaceae bacterium]|nr:MAG: hypothetical protein KatS3mg114_0760 [Planctomycetaceae bacterium]
MTEVRAWIQRKLMVCGLLAFAWGRPSLTPAWTDEAPAGELLLIVGAAGSTDYARQFAAWAEQWKRAAQAARYAGICLTAENEESSAQPALPLKQRWHTWLNAADHQGSRPLWVVLIGHGTYDRRTARFNLPGPDVSAEELASWLEPFTRPLIIIDTTACSAPFLVSLARPGRIVITATKGGGEQNFTRFGEYLAQAWWEPRADLDKDDAVSLLEAFLYASRRTADFYKTEGRLRTEHALLDDDGDGQGTRAEDYVGLHPREEGMQVDGLRAHLTFLVPSSQEADWSPDRRAARQLLEQQLLELRQRKAQLPPAEYAHQLEFLLLQLAELTFSPR